MIQALTLVVMASTAQVEMKPLTCPIMGSPVSATSKAYEVAGMRMAICCGGCDVKLAKDPMKALTEAGKKGWVVAEFAFDAVSGAKVDLKEAEFKVDMNGVRYSFQSEENFDLFKKNPKAFTKMPKAELGTCPVSGEPIKSPISSAGFADYEGVRYFFCCPDCSGVFRKNPLDYATKNSEKVGALRVLAAK